MADAVSATATRAVSAGPPYRWVVLGIATLAQVSTCFLVQGLGPLAGYIQSGLHLGAFEIGLLISAAQLVPVVGLLVAGELLDRVSERYLVGLGALVVAGGLAGGALAGSYESLLVWLIVVGAGYSTAQPGGSKLVSTWFSRSQRGLAMGIRQAGLPLGGALAAAILPAVAAAHGWRAAFVVGAGFACLGGIALMAFYRPAPARPGRSATSDDAPSRLSLLRDPRMRDVMWSGMTLVTVQYGILLFMALYLHDRFGTSFAAGARLLVVALLAGALGRIVLAAWSDRCARGRYFPVVMSMCALAVGLLALIVSGSASPVVWGCLAAWLGFFGYGWYGPWVAYVSESAGAARMGFALGLAMAVNQVTVVLSPPALGLARDLTGSYLVSWLVLIGMLVVAVTMTSRRRAHAVPRT
jgi:MFS family permease